MHALVARIKGQEKKLVDIVPTHYLLLAISKLKSKAKTWVQIKGKDILEKWKESTVKIWFFNIYF